MELRPGGSGNSTQRIEKGLCSKVKTDPAVRLEEDDQK
jgi:hypothetical protein